MLTAQIIKKFPCPSCTWRGPVWLDENYHCTRCDYTYQPGSDNYAWIWRVVPLEWWLEESMIEADEIPTAAKDDPASIAGFFTGPDESTRREPYVACEEWAIEHGYDLDDDEQREAAIEAYHNAIV